jgi:hypothetical protein
MLRREETEIGGVYEGTNDGLYVLETWIEEVYCRNRQRTLHVATAMVGRVAAAACYCSGRAQESNFDRPPSRYSSCKILVILFFYIGTSIYSISEVFIGRSLIVSRYLLANLKGIRLAVPTLKTHLSTFTSLILHISWKKVQIVP